MSAALRTIGQVLDLVRPEFPEITVSKIRFLEREGLIAPERDQPSGYRRYAQADVDRLRYVLRAQRDHYLPLRVIRQNLEAIDRGEEPSRPPDPDTAPEVERPPPEPRSGNQRPERRNLRLTRRELLQQAGIGEATLIELERSGLLRPRRGAQHYGRDALTVAVAARRLSRFGLGAAQMRAIRDAALLETDIVDAALGPGARDPAARTEALTEVLRLVLHAHAAVLRTLCQK